MEASSEPPLWLLDIDGVLNALVRGLPTGAWSAEDWVQRVVTAPVDGRGLMALPILAARPVLDFVTRVHTSGAAEVRWHSTWRAAAVTHLAPALGLPSMPISIAPEWLGESDVLWWKLPAAQRAVAAGRRLVWTDDDINVYSGHDDPSTAAAMAAIAERDDTLLVSPGRESGLQRSDLNAIAGFLGISA